MLIAVASALEHRSEVVTRYVAGFADCLIVLLHLYLPLSVVSVIVVIARNIL